MKKKKEVKTKIKKESFLEPNEIYSTTVIKDKDGKAVIKSYKKFIDRTATVIIDDNEPEYDSDMEDSSSPLGWEKVVK